MRTNRPLPMSPFAVGVFVAACVVPALVGCSTPSPRPGALDASILGDDISFPDILPPGDIPAVADAGTPDVVPASISLGVGTDVANYDQRSNLGFQVGWPDGQIGALMNGTTWTFYGSAYSNGSCSGTPQTQGAYRLGGTPDVLSASYGCTALITEDTTGAPYEPNNLIGLFDRDYVGGGPVARITNPSTGAQAVIMLYHAEFYWGAICANEDPCYYGTLGLAFSTDGGMTFTRLGEVVQPYADRAQGMTSKTVDTGSGTLVLGDINGYPIPEPANASPENTYFYIFYTDQDSSIGCGGYCITVARARVLDVATAVFNDDPGALTTLFHKYRQGSWTQPAVSGDPNDAINSGEFTPILPTGLFPAVLYDRTINQFIMAVINPTSTGSDIVFRTAYSLLDWSDILTEVSVHEAGNTLIYPSLLGETGNPSIGGTLPWLFYVSGPTDNANWSAAVLRNHVLQVE